MKKFILTMFTAILFLNYGIGQMVDVTVATVSGTSGQIALVPVTASGIDESNGGTPIIGLNINVFYNPALVTFIGITDYNAILTAVGSWNGSAVDNGMVHVDYQTTDIEVPVSMPDGQVLYNLNFIANAGVTPAPLTLNTVEFNDVNGVLIPTTLFNGSITFGAPLANATWNGTGAWYTLANWTPGLPGKSTVTTIATGIVTIDATTAYTGNASINAGAGVTINTGRTLYVNGNLTLESNAGMTATGSLLRNGNLTVIGTTISKRYMTGGVQHFISIPVSSAKISDLISPGNTGYFFKFNEPGNNWENPWDPNYTLVPSVGYSVNYNNPETIEVSGISNNDGTYTAPVSRTGNGWNLVGNPFPIGLDWNNASGWTKTNIDNAIYIWNNAVYASYVGGVGANGGTQYIPQSQGFFVHSSTGTPTFAIKKAARTHTANGTNFMKEEVANVFRLAVSNGSLGEETVVYMNSQATESFDTEYDAYKLFGFNTEAPHIYTRTNETDYAINGQPMVESVSLPVLVKTSQSGEFTFTASGFESFDGYYFFILEDKETGINYDLVKNSEIVLNLNTGETNDRFTLRIFKSALGIGDDVSASTRIYAENKSVYIENCPKGQVNIYNMAGKNVSSNMLAESALNMISLNVPAGIYVVKMTTQNGSISSKVFIK